jgi:AraC family transcriptional regulator, transcriptional activator of pobA
MVSLGQNHAQQFKQLVDKYYAVHHKVHEYAGMLNIVPKHLNKCCKREFGISAHRVITNKILFEASIRLTNPNNTVKVIAYSLGFCDPVHFTHFFKKHTNSTPSEFRIQEGVILTSESVI